MRNNLRMPIAWLCFWAALTFPLCVAAQTIAPQHQLVSHHHYKLVVIGPLGGPSSNLSGPEVLTLNNQGAFAVYFNTAAPNPNANCAIPFNANGGGGDCFVEHPALWHNGTLTDLELLPGGANGQTSSISANDLVTGWSENGLFDSAGLPVGRAVLWTKDRKVIDLGTVPGGSGSLATANNNRGEVVGFADNGVLDPFSIAGVATQTRAFLWQNGVIKDLGTLGGADALAGNVNEAGEVAGVSYTNSDFSMNCSFPLTTHAFFWEDGKMTDVGTFGGSCSFAGWMNNRGQIIGYANTPDENNHAFVWDKQRGLRNLGELPGGVFSGAQWINDAGDVVGGSDGGLFFHATLWKNGAVIDLGTLYGETCSGANSINSGGQIVGFTSADCFNEDHVFLAENGGIVDASTLIVGGTDLALVNAYNINDRGEIAVHAYNPSGDQRAVLLIPCDSGHSNLEGCDYSQVEASLPPVFTSAPANPAKSLNAARMMRLRARMASRYHRF